MPGMYIIGGWEIAYCDGAEKALRKMNNAWENDKPNCNGVLSIPALLCFLHIDLCAMEIINIVQIKIQQ